MILILRERLLNKVNIRKEELINILSKGKAEDFSSYKYLTGQIRGLEESVEIIKEVFKHDESE